jgi:hypothetical protein
MALSISAIPNTDTAIFVVFALPLIAVVSILKTKDTKIGLLNPWYILAILIIYRRLGKV